VIRPPNIGKDVRVFDVGKQVHPVYYEFLIF